MLITIKSGSFKDSTRCFPIYTAMCPAAVPTATIRARAVYRFVPRSARITPSATRSFDIIRAITSIEPTTPSAVVHLYPFYTYQARCRVRHATFGLKYFFIFVIITIHARIGPINLKQFWNDLQRPSRRVAHDSQCVYVIWVNGSRKCVKGE